MGLDKRENPPEENKANNEIERFWNEIFSDFQC
jgi:hypothetical protein